MSVRYIKIGAQNYEGWIESMDIDIENMGFGVERDKRLLYDCFKQVCKRLAATEEKYR